MANSNTKLRMRTMAATIQKQNNNNMTQGHIGRAYTSFQPTWQRFRSLPSSITSGNIGEPVASSSSHQHHPYSRQYSHVYSARLSALRERCMENADQSLKKFSQKCGLIESVDNRCGVSAKVVDRIIDVKEGVLSVLVGTISKETDPKRRPPVDSSYRTASTLSFIFPSGDPSGENGSTDDKNDSLRSYMFDSGAGDVIHLEDESGRVELVPTTVNERDGSNKHALDPNKIATGVVAAVVGRVSAEKGVMEVESIHFAAPPPNTFIEADSVRERNEFRGCLAGDDESDGPFLLLISGLDCGFDSRADITSSGSLSLRREMLLDYLTQPLLGNGPSVCRIIVAGGGVVSPSSVRKVFDSNSNKENQDEQTKKKFNSFAQSKTSAVSNTNGIAYSLRELDHFFSEILSSGIPVDYIPGWNDPTNANWPQRPIHSCLLPHSCSFADLFERSTNPYEAILGCKSENGSSGLRVLGSDGLNIADLRRFLAFEPHEKGNLSVGANNGNQKEQERPISPERMTSSMNALHQTLRYSHMAPTGPDSLPMFPLSESDPFVIQKRPNIYFAGNCEKFETMLVDSNYEEIADDAADVNRGLRTRLVCVPSFSSTGETVLVQLKTLQCKVVKFHDLPM